MWENLNRIFIEMDSLTSTFKLDQMINIRVYGMISSNWEGRKNRKIDLRLGLLNTKEMIMI